MRAARPFWLRSRFAVTDCIADRTPDLRAFVGFRRYDSALARAAEEIQLVALPARCVEGILSTWKILLAGPGGGAAGPSSSMFTPSAQQDLP